MGEHDLATLLRNMAPILDPQPYAYCVVEPHVYAELKLSALGVFREAEGITLIVPQALADQAGLGYSESWARITLMVHSALSAVGLTAAVATKLASVGVSCNVVAAYYHDHLFVAWGDRLRALAALEDLANT